jgi:hypothetical protein
MTLVPDALASLLDCETLVLNNLRHGLLHNAFHCLPRLEAENAKATMGVDV